MFQTTSQTETSQIILAVAWAPLLILGWLVGLVLIGVGFVKRDPRFLSYGFIITGLMAIITPTVYYLHEIDINGGHFEASAFDFLVTVGLGSLGGLFIGIGALRPRSILRK